MIHAHVENQIPPSPGQGLPPPSDPAFRLRPTTRLGLALALLVSAATVWASSRFVRKALPPVQTQTGLTVEKGTVAIASGAPQWQVLALETAKPIALPDAPPNVQVLYSSESPDQQPPAGFGEGIFE